MPAGGGEGLGEGVDKDEAGAGFVGEGGGRRGRGIAEEVEGDGELKDGGVIGFGQGKTAGCLGLAAAGELLNTGLAGSGKGDGDAAPQGMEVDKLERGESPASGAAEETKGGGDGAHISILHFQIDSHFALLLLLPLQRDL